MKALITRSCRRLTRSGRRPYLSITLCSSVSDNTVDVPSPIQEESVTGKVLASSPPVSHKRAFVVHAYKRVDRCIDI